MLNIGHHDDNGNHRRTYVSVTAKAMVVIIVTSARSAVGECLAQTTSMVQYRSAVIFAA